MYLLSPEGDTVFYIPGVEVVHRAPGGLQVLDKLAGMEGKMQPPSGGRKRQNLTLDLNSASSKKNRGQNLATPTPSGYIFPKSVTEEQAMYAKGFEEALEHP